MVKRIPLNWFKKAANQGLARAQYHLGVCYETGMGDVYNNIQIDLHEAIKWYRKAAEQGYELGQLMLGNCYEYGKVGVNKDLNEAINWYRKAAKQGHPVGQKKLDELLTSDMTKND